MGESAKMCEEQLRHVMETTVWCEVCSYPIRNGACENCAEIQGQREFAKEKQRLADIERLGGLRAYEDYTWDKFDNMYYDGKRAMEIALAHPNLYIWGARGTGKSHLATVLVRRKDFGVVVKPQNMMRVLKERVLDSKKEQELLDILINHRALCIDDLGVEKLTPHTRSLLYEIIDGRWANKKEGLVITSNFSLDELSAHIEDDRIPSRIAGLCKVIRLTGADRRIHTGE